MKAALVLVGMGALALVIEGVLVSFLPVLLLPDVALLCCVAAALSLDGAASLLTLAGLGFGADLLAGAPLGLHVLALLPPFAAARVANGSLELRHGVPEAVLVAVLTPVAGLGAVGWMHLAGVPADLGLGFWLGLAVQTAVNAAMAPGACLLAEGVASLTGDLDPTRRGVAYVGTGPWAASRR